MAGARLGHDQLAARLAHFFQPAHNEPQPRRVAEADVRKLQPQHLRVLALDEQVELRARGFGRMVVDFAVEGRR